MKYVCVDGYREFRGRVFAFGRPVEITDPGTLEAISHNPYFKEVPDEKVQETAETEVLKRRVLRLRKSGRDDII